MRTWSRVKVDFSHVNASLDNRFSLTGHFEENRRNVNVGEKHFSSTKKHEQVWICHKVR